MARPKRLKRAKANTDKGVKAKNRVKAANAAIAIKPEPSAAPVEEMSYRTERSLAIDGLGSDSDLRLLESGDWSDAEIRCLGKKWLVHKSVLCTRCTWFSDMFTGPWTESRLTIDPEEFDGRSSIEVAIELWYIGDYFKLPELCDRTMSFMQDTMRDIIADQNTVVIMRDSKNHASVRMKFEPLQWEDIVGIVKGAYRYASPEPDLPRMKALVYLQGVVWRHSQAEIEKLYDERSDFARFFIKRITQYTWMNRSLVDTSKEKIKTAILNKKKKMVCAHADCRR